MARTGVGEWVAALAGSVLVLSLFAPWQHQPAADPAVVVTRSGWSTFGLFAVALAALGALPVWHLIRRLQARRGPPPSWC